MNQRLRYALAFVTLTYAASPIVSAETPQQAFAKRWQGRAVILRQPLYTLVYNERGKLGTTKNNRRDGLTVTTPSNGVYYLFEGRHDRDDITMRQPGGMVAAVSAAYEADSLEVRSYRKVEPIVLNRYDPGVELVISRVQIDRDTVRVVFTLGGDTDEATWLTVKWPVPLSKSLTEADVLEGMIRQFFDFAAPATKQ